MTGSHHADDDLPLPSALRSQPITTRSVGHQPAPFAAGGQQAVVLPAELIPRLRLFERAVGAAGNGIVITDAQAPDNPIIYVNPAFERITGYPVGEILGRNCRFLQGDDREQAARSTLRAAIAAGRETTVILRNYRKDGTPFWNELSLAPVRDDTGRVTHFVGVQADVTARRQAEVRLRLLADAGAVLLRGADEQVALAALTEVLVPALVDWCAIDLYGAADRARRVAALHREPVYLPLLQSLSLAPLVRDSPTLYEDAADLVSDWPEAYERGVLGRLGLTSCMSLPVRTDEHAYGAMVLATGSSGRRLERDDLTMAEELASRVVLMLDNGRLRSAAEAAERGRDEFLSAVSHDLKTPVAGIKGMAQVLQRRLARGHEVDAARVLRTLEAIDAATTRLTEAIGQLLDVRRARSGQTLSLAPSPTDLVSLLHALVERHQATTTRHRLTFHSPLDALVGYYDAERLAHAVDNLLVNALTFSPDGGEICVTLARDKSTAGTWALVTVEDNGIGIPAADLPRIFDRFYRGSNVIPRMQGSGLGLTSVRQIIESHGGNVTVESQQGAGAIFALRLPLPATDLPTGDERSPTA